MLELDDVHAGYGLSEVLFGVSLSVHPGETVALVGRNGAGKSSTIKSIMGMVGWRRGTIRFHNRNIMDLKPDRIAQLGIGYVPQERRVFGSLTVEENLRVAQKAAGLPVSDFSEIYDIFPTLDELRTRKAGNLSGGEQQMLTVGRALVLEPDLLLLDEPSEGLAPLIVRTLLEGIEMLQEQETTLLISEQNMKVVERLAGRLYVIQKGQIRFEGSYEELQDAEEIRRKYLMV